MASLALGVRFIPASSGTGDFVSSATVVGYAGTSTLVDGKAYRYRAESADLSQWEWGTGIWTASTSTLARTTVTLSSTGSKVAFSSIPQVGIVIFPADVVQFDDPMSLTPAQQLQAKQNIGVMVRCLSYSRVLSVAAGNVSYTGIGFKPRLLQLTLCISGGAPWGSTGFTDGVAQNTQEVSVQTGGAVYAQSNIIGIQRDNSAGSNYQVAVLVSFDSDGFTLSWTKIGTPTATALIFATAWQ